MLQTANLSFSYPDQSLDFQDLYCQPNEPTLILGASGSGKTTLLQLLGGLRKPRSGTVIIDNTEVSRLKGKSLDIFRGKHIGFVFQQPHFVPSISIKQNLMLSRSLAKLKADEKLLNELLQSLDIHSIQDKKPAHLSVGQQQRASIASALINEPKVILADEPTSALDDKNAMNVIQLLKEKSIALKATLIIVTHDQRLKNSFHKKYVL